MKKVYILFFLIISAALLILSACSEDGDTVTPGEEACVGTVFSGAKSIPDNGTLVIPVTNNCSAAGFVSNIVLTNLEITHTWNADLDIYLVNPDRDITNEISTDNGGSGDGYYRAVFYDDALSAVSSLEGVNTDDISGPWYPESPMSAFNGTRSDGVWRLIITDDTSGNVGKVKLFRLIIQ